MTRSRRARVLTIIGLTALLALSACGDHNDRPALTGDVVTTVSTTTTTAAP
jgi:hypothetical protein